MLSSKDFCMLSPNWIFNNCKFKKEIFSFRVSGSASFKLKPSIERVKAISNISNHIQFISFLTLFALWPNSDSILLFLQLHSHTCDDKHGYCKLCLFSKKKFSLHKKDLKLVICLLLWGKSIFLHFKWKKSIFLIILFAFDSTTPLKDIKGLLLLVGPKAVDDKGRWVVKSAIKIWKNYLQF